jgi:hypothetical protein
LRIAKQYPVKAVEIKPEAFSFGRALNAGCSVSSGEFILIASAQLYPIYSDWIEKIWSHFKNPSIGLVYGKQIGGKETHFSEDQIFAKWFPQKTDTMQAHPFCNNANSAIRRVMWEQQKYDEDLMGLEDIDWAHRAMRKGVWEKIPGRALRECTLGIIGVGDFGKTVARRAMTLGYASWEPTSWICRRTSLLKPKIVMLPMKELLREADFVSINCALNPTSHHLMDEAMFGLMKTTAALINTARGPIVKERALVNALETGAIAGAALDVFEDEPLPAASALTGMDNVMLAPHNANSSPEAWEKVHINTINNLLTVLNA